MSARSTRSMTAVLQEIEPHVDVRHAWVRLANRPVDGARTGRAVLGASFQVFLPFLIIALTLVAGLLLGPDRRPSPRRTVGTIVAGSFLVLVALNFAWFWPIWTNELLTRSDWYDRIWFSRWI